MVKNQKINFKLRVWWIPQVPIQAFYVSVKNVEEAKLILKTLADYDLFQLHHNVKPDYSNVGGLQYWDKPQNEWLEWENENGDTIDDLLEKDP